MKEIILDNGKALLLKNKYEMNVKIGKRDNSYYIIHNSKARGPFKKILLDSANAENVIIGYNDEERKFYSIDSTGLKLIKKEKINLDEETNHTINLDNCTLVSTIDSYSIYINENTGKLFVIDTKGKKNTLSTYKEFDTYEDLINYYKQNYDISLFGIEARAVLSKEAHLLIKFKDLYSSTIQLKPDDLSEDILFDILTDRFAIKKIFDMQKRKLFTTIYGSKKSNELIEQGYKELTSSTYENILKRYPDEMALYYDLAQNKINELKPNCSSYIKQTDDLDFCRLESHLHKLSIKDLPKQSITEITANRPLSKGVFLSMLCACFDKLEEEGSSIKQGYRKSNNFKYTYPNEYSRLWNIASSKLPELSNEYFEIKRKLLYN